MDDKYDERILGLLCENEELKRKYASLRSDVDSLEGMLRCPSNVLPQLPKTNELSFVSKRVHDLLRFEFEKLDKGDAQQWLQIGRNTALENKDGAISCLQQGYRHTFFPKVLWPYSSSNRAVRGEILFELSLLFFGRDNEVSAMYSFEALHYLSDSRESRFRVAEHLKSIISKLGSSWSNNSAAPAAHYVLSRLTGAAVYFQKEHYCNFVERFKSERGKDWTLRC